MASNMDEFWRLSVIKAQGYSKGGMRGNGKITDFVKNVYNKAK